MKMKPTVIVLALIVAALGAAACGGGASNANSAANANTATADANKNSNSKPPSMRTAEGTFRVAYEAIKAKDYEAFKKTLTKDYIDQLQDLANREKKTVNDVIAQGVKKHPVPENPETRNIEQQDDGSVRMEFKDGNGEWLVVYMIQDGDDWKFKPGPGSNLLEDIATGSGKEVNANEKDIKGKGFKEKK